MYISVLEDTGVECYECRKKEKRMYLVCFNNPYTSLQQHVVLCKACLYTVARSLLKFYEEECLYKYCKRVKLIHTS